MNLRKLKAKSTDPDKKIFMELEKGWYVARSLNHTAELRRTAAEYTLPFVDNLLSFRRHRLCKLEKASRDFLNARRWLLSYTILFEGVYALIKFLYEEFRCWSQIMTLGKSTHNISLHWPTRVWWPWSNLEIESFVYVRLWYFLTYL